MNAVKFAVLGLVGVIGLLISTFGPFKIPYAETLAKTYYRHAIAGLLIVALLLGGLIAIAVHTLNPNQFKSQIVRYVQERTQRELILDGELELSWFPKLGFTAGKASLSQHRSAREFAAIDSARVTIAWLPLLRRQVQIDWAEVDGLRAQVVRFKDGTTNIDDLMRDLATISPERIDIEGLHLKRATLQWNDEMVFQRGSLNDLQLSVGRLTDGMAAPVTASLRVDAPHAGIDARLSLKGRLLFDAQAKRIELAKIDAQLEGKSLGVDNLALRMLADVTGHLGLNTLSAENVVITSSSKSGLSVLNARLAAPELRFIERRFQGSQLSMDFSVAHPDQTLTAALQVPSFESSGRTLRGATANAQVSIRAAGAHQRAQLSSPVLFDLDAGPRLEFEAIDTTASASHPALASEIALVAGGKAVLDMGQRSLHLALAGKLGSQELRGQLALTDWRRPHWTFEVAAETIDLDAMLAQPCMARWNDDALAVDLSALRELSLAGQLRAEKLKVCGLTARSFSAQFDAQRSALHITPVKALAYGAALEGSVAIDAAGAPRIAFKGNFSELDLRALRADLAQLPWLEGRAALAWDVQATGGSLGTLRAGLSGPLTLGVHSGKMVGVDLRATMLEGRGDVGKASPSLQQDFNAGAVTQFGDMKAHIELREGQAHGQSLAVSAGPIQAVGTGELWLDAGRLDIRLDASVGKAGQELAALTGVSVPIQVTGSWRAPRYTFDFGAATGGVATRPMDPVPQAVEVAQSSSAAPEAAKPAAVVKTVSVPVQPTSAKRASPAPKAR